MAAEARIRVNGDLGEIFAVSLGDDLEFTNDDDTDVVTWAWSFLTQPPGAADNITGAATDTGTATVRKEHSYLLELLVNEGLPDESRHRVVVYVPDLLTGERIPAAGETIQASTSVGWALAAHPMLRHVLNASASGVEVVGEAGEAGLVPGNVVRVSGRSVIAETFPDERYVPSWTKALGTTAGHLDEVLGVVVAGVDGDLTPESGDLIRVLVCGLLDLELAGAPAVGDNVYVSNAGTIATSAGTNARAIGHVVEAGGGNYRVFVNGPSGAGGATNDAPYLTDGASAGLTNERNIQAITSTLVFEAAADVTPLVAQRHAAAPTHSQPIIAARDENGVDLAWITANGNLLIQHDVSPGVFLRRLDLANDGVVLWMLNGGNPRAQLVTTGAHPIEIQTDETTRMRVGLTEIELTLDLMPELDDGNTDLGASDQRFGTLYLHSAGLGVVFPGDATVYGSSDRLGLVGELGIDFFEDTVSPSLLAQLESTDFRPSDHRVKDLGTASNSWRDVYSRTLSSGDYAPIGVVGVPEMGISVEAAGSATIPGTDEALAGRWVRATTVAWELTPDTHITWQYGGDTVNSDDSETPFDVVATMQIGAPTRGGGSPSISNPAALWLTPSSTDDGRLLIGAAANVEGVAGLDGSIRVFRPSVASAIFRDPTNNIEVEVGVSNALGGAFLQAPTNHPILLRTNGTTVGYLSTGGDLGLGTTSPQDELHIHRVGEAANVRLTTDTSGATSGDGFSFGLDTDNQVYVWQYESSTINFGTSNAQRWSMTASGHWVSSSGVWLGVGGTPSAEIHAVNAGANSVPALRLQNDAITWAWSVRGDEDDRMRFGTLSAVGLDLLTTSHVQFGTDGDDANPTLATRADPNTGLRWNSDDTLRVSINSAEGARFSAPGDGELALLLRRNVGGVFTLARVKFGGTSTGPGGTGRALYIDD